MDYLEDEDDEIIGFRRPKKYTNIDFREKLALNTEGKRQRLNLSALIDNESEFNDINACSLSPTQRDQRSTKW